MVRPLACLGHVKLAVSDRGQYANIVQDYNPASKLTLAQCWDNVSTSVDPTLPSDVGPT